MSDFEMLSIKFQEEGLKEIQVFVGMTHSFKDGSDFNLADFDIEYYAA